MKVYKRKFLKDNVRLSTLARKAGITPVYLSKIINNHTVPSDELAETLAKQANLLSFQTDYFTATDFIPKVTIKVTEQ